MIISNLLDARLGFIPLEIGPWSCTCMSHRSDDCTPSSASGRSRSTAPLVSRCACGRGHHRGDGVRRLGPVLVLNLVIIAVGVAHRSSRPSVTRPARQSGASWCLVSRPPVARRQPDAAAGVRGDRCTLEPMHQAYSRTAGDHVLRFELGCGAGPCGLGARRMVRRRDRPGGRDPAVRTDGTQAERRRPRARRPGGW